MEDEYVKNKNQKGGLLQARENSGKWTANIYIGEYITAWSEKERI